MHVDNITYRQQKRLLLRDSVQAYAGGGGGVRYYC
jgi:hypothetical protein